MSVLPIILKIPWSHSKSRADVHLPNSSFFYSYLGSKLVYTRKPRKSLYHPNHFFWICTKVAVFRPPPEFDLTTKGLFTRNKKHTDIQTVIFGLHSNKLRCSHSTDICRFVRLRWVTDPFVPKFYITIEWNIDNGYISFRVNQVSISTVQPFTNEHFVTRKLESLYAIIRSMWSFYPSILPWLV